VSPEVKELRSELRAALKRNEHLENRVRELEFELTEAIPPLQLYARRYARFLTAWERDFVSSLAKWSGPLSPKQQGILSRIEGKTGASIPLPDTPAQARLSDGYPIPPVIH
jgi:hypothetical protein